ncbi:MAG: protein kinase [Candidatus Acinetobacter avistercoris]|uniref:protein kinase domain-containing protein n=1 Tax=Acinetobacter sp. KS-LM10 TaxID=3120518 RepID=UPI001F9F350D|nr:protein kinase [Candidatus Acinetobacter avistercoris]
MLKPIQLIPSQILPQLKQSCNPIRSQNFGRHIFQVEMDDQRYWLKVQKKGYSDEHEQSFQNEILNYQIIFKQQPEVLAPFNIVHAQLNCGLDSSYLEQGLFLAESESLFSIDPYAIDIAEVKKRLLESLSVLEKLHGIGLIHGDLKGEHFRVFENRCVLIDFEQCHQPAQANGIKNTATPRYMAPELFHAHAKSYASDVYALGIIWLQWLSQNTLQATQNSLQAKSYYDWAILHCQNLKVELPAAFIRFKAVLESMLAKEKSQRCINFYHLKQLLSENV